jgi:hypothetical protein
LAENAKDQERRDMSKVDICDRLRLAPAHLIGTVDEDTYWACHEAADEIERLRLTDEERVALKTVMRRVREDYFAGRFADSVEVAAVIDGLLERLK